MTGPTLSQALAEAERRLAPLHDSARLDAEVLLAHVLGWPRARLRAWPEQVLSEAQRAAFEQLIARRAQGEPVAYLTGQREFWSLPLRVTPDTLIPRPETERLVELGLALIPDDAAWRIADLGTGSGAIALALAKERPRCHIVASDVSARALAVAQANAARLGISNVEFRQGAWLAPLDDERFDLIASNPPYIAEDDAHLAEGDARFEPRGALASGVDGLDDVRQIARDARTYLRPGGWLLLEHGYDQGDAVVALLRELGYQEVCDERDFAGHGRIARARMTRQADTMLPGTSGAAGPA